MVGCDSGFYVVCYFELLYLLCSCLDGKYVDIYSWVLLLG